MRIYADAKGTPWGVSLWDAKLCDNNTCNSASTTSSTAESTVFGRVDNADPEDTLVDMADPGLLGFVGQ